jgi:hypothetical protein
MRTRGCDSKLTAPAGLASGIAPICVARKLDSNIRRTYNVRSSGSRTRSMLFEANHCAALDPRSPERRFRGKACERAGNAVAKAEQILPGGSGRERELGREFILLDRLQALGNACARQREGKWPSCGGGRDGASEMAPQALGKIDFGDGNGAIVVGGRRIKGLPNRSDEGTGFGAQRRPRSRTGLHGARAPNLIRE